MPVANSKIFKDTVIGLLETIEREEKNNIDKAAELMAKTIKDGKLIHVIGPGGHSNMGAFEMFMRAGGLVPVNAILDPGTLVNFGARRSTAIERTPGYGITVLEAYNIVDGILIIVNAYGINSMTIDVALEARRRGVPTIGVASREFSERIPQNHPARHPSNKNLCDNVDIYVDCHMPYGDAVVSLEGLKPKVGPVSTIVNAFTVNLMVIRTAEILLAEGIEPPIFASGNIPGGDEYNKKLQEKYPPELFYHG